MLTKTALLTGVGLGLAARASAGFTLTAPAGIENKGNGTIPCGEYDALDRTQVTDWPVLGHDVGVNIDDGASTFVIRAALVDDLTKFKTLRPAVHHRRGGDFCFMRIRGVEDWIGQNALVEVQQYSGGGEYTYRCVAVVFSEGGPAPPACRGFHEQLVANHERRLAEMAQAEPVRLDQNQETRLEQRDLGIQHQGDDTVRAAVVDLDDDDDAVDGQMALTPSAGTVPASTYTHLPATPAAWGAIGKRHSYGRHLPWGQNRTAPRPTNQADMLGKTPGGGPAGATPTPGGQRLKPVPESEAAGFARGFVLLNLGLIASLVTLFSL